MVFVLIGWRDPVSLRRFVLVTHRWLGIAMAVPLFVVCASGAAIVWPDVFPLRKFLGSVHEDFALRMVGMASVGRWIVVATTVLAVVLVLGGIFLWWKRKSVSVRLDLGFKRTMFDLHNALGVIGFLMMLLLSVTGVGMAFTTPEDGELRRVIFDLHTTRGYLIVIKVVYTLASTVFAVQCATGVLSWWKPRRAIPKS